MNMGSGKKKCLYKSISRGQCSINMIRQSHNVMQQKQEAILEENNNRKKKGGGEHVVLKLPID